MIRRISHRRRVAMEEQAGYATAWRVRAVTLGLIVVVLIAALACTSKPRSKERMAEKASGNAGRSATAQSVSDPGWPTAAVACDAL